MLHKYSDNLVGLDSLRLEKQAVIDTILTPEIKAKLAEIEAEFAPKVEALSAENERLAAQIREQVLELGATVSGDFHQAIFTKGRVSWDTKALDGYAAAHPEVATFRKEGQPSVSIRLRG